MVHLDLEAQEQDRHHSPRSKQLPWRREPTAQDRLPAKPQHDHQQQLPGPHRQLRRPTPHHQRSSRQKGTPSRLPHHLRRRREGTFHPRQELRPCLHNNRARRTLPPIHTRSPMARLLRVPKTIKIFRQV
ncbi:hypothetical protein FA10DRAFT_111974 [Acaromyces ingoldii]|uniref:Uncharacterized protein n=1 Tax=Acaromyces ingoldii TaxID=215250 RepID=A0A316YLD8_9BASI|nr:hypothetical protein FA10DRAFT_111974 [Acaromyces ingoldii]PWN90380.1 hypothetical protein FA10DRAFT_111974 [Acaromyces ingoldii]